MQNVHFSPPQVADLFDVNVSTVKRWVDAGYIVAHKTAGGHRRISQESLQDFIQTYEGLSNQSYVLSRLSGEGSLSQTDWQTYFDLLLEHRTRDALVFLKKIYVQQKDVLVVIEDYINPVLREIGERWSRGEMDIADEHRMSFLITEHIWYVSSFIPIPKKPKRVCAVACVPTDNHVIPVYLIQAIMKQCGWDVILLGINTPFTEIERTIKHYELDIVFLSKTYAEESTIDFVQNVEHCAQKENIKVCCGGAGWTRADRSKADSDTVFCDSFRSIPKMCR